MLFQPGPFVSHSGLTLSFKIACDDLTLADWQCIADLIGPRLKFSYVVGVPRGGLALADCLRRYEKPDGPTLVVDDILTTGNSMNEVRDTIAGPCVGVVLFSRMVPVPQWITPVFQLDRAFLDSPVPERSLK